MYMCVVNLFWGTKKEVEKGWKKGEMQGMDGAENGVGVCVLLWKENRE